MAKKAAHTLTGFRRGADVATCYLALGFAGLGIVQIFLAGVGVFGHDFDMHTLLGRVLSTIAILIVIFALAARRSKKDVVLAIIILILAGAATSIFANLGWDSKWLGGMHALSGIVSVIIADHLSRRVFKKSA